MRHEKTILPSVTQHNHKHSHRVSLLFLQRTQESHDAGFTDERAPYEAGPANQALWLDEFTGRVKFWDQTGLKRTVKIN
jgi:hypothetical protein